MPSEAATRAEIIDLRLKDAGWDVLDRTQVIEEFFTAPHGSTKGAGSMVRDESVPYGSREFSDYVLLGKNGQALAVVEAKRSSKDAAVGREQAKQYCYHIQKQHGGELPFCFYTNGLETFFWDLDNYPPRKVVGFPTRDDLERFQYIRRNRKPLTQELINTAIAGRDYQIRAIRAVLEGIEKKKRDFLLVMATGTGKTRTCIAMIDALMRAGHAEKVLFLVDRIALREQALETFKEHLPHEPRWPNVGEKLIAKDRRIYVSTYPTMLNIIRDETQQLSPHFFDLIVIDESHRSIYNTYGEILDYFKTITLGLTATPTDIIDHNTFKLFYCEDGLPTFAYTFEEAVNNVPPYLCNFQVMKIQTKFQMQGISKRTISLEDQKKLLLEGKEIEEINFEGSQLEKQVINKGTNALIVKEFMEECIKDQNGVLPGKTIFFCSSKAHARRLEEIFDHLYPQYKGELAKVLVSEDPRVYGKGGLLDQFKNNDMPRVDDVMRTDATICAKRKKSGSKNDNCKFWKKELKKENPMSFELPWIKCGVIAELTTQLEQVSPQFGKTVLQKMVFLLQEVYHVDVGYDFGFHTFGPFAAELLGDLNFAESMGFVTVKSVEETGGNGYIIKSGDIIGGILQNVTVSPFLSQHKEAIDALVKGFGDKTAKELELLTTIIYLNKEIMWDANKLTQEAAISKIRELKPKFSAGEIVDGMIELKTKHHVGLVFAA